MSTALNTIPVVAAAPNGFDVERVRADFPILRGTVHGRPLVYLDSAASTQKPQAVIDTLARFYAHDYANIHRGVYELSQRATEAHDAAREKLRHFINAADRREVIFTRNATESINLVAQSFARPRLGPGDEILITAMEHHANIVPWQMACQQTGARLVVAPINDDGELLMDELAARLSGRTRIVALAWVSNALGTVNPVRDVIDLAHAKGAAVLIDGAQAVQHMPVDVRELDCEFFVFSGHKMYGPSGVGVCYGKAELLEAMPPWQGAGDMIASVSFEHTEYNDLPYKFEAGTPDIAGAVALGAAVDYIEGLGIENIAAHEAELLAYATRAIRQVPGLRLIGTAREKCSVLSFVMEGAHPQDIGTLLDLDGIAVRTGQHCAQPVIERMGLNSTARASIGVYSNRDDIDALVKGLRRVASMFA
ncbi:MAG TPA: cysteine desulfurase [Geminicoccaceae bacterium]|nr:cysteine desulfurase [Geminicoccaceae bacterium]